MLCVNTELFELDFYEYFVCRKAKLSVCMKGVEGVAGVELLFFRENSCVFPEKFFKNPQKALKAKIKAKNYRATPYTTHHPLNYNFFSSFFSFIVDYCSRNNCERLIFVQSRRIMSDCFKVQQLRAVTEVFTSAHAPTLAGQSIN